MLRKLDAGDCARRMSWLSGPTWPPSGGDTGFDPTGRWPAGVWVLNAMYERDDMQPDLTHHELHQQAIAAGMQQPAIVGGVNLDEVAITTGVGLGFAETPPPPWQRLTWSELGRRDGFALWAVDGKWPTLRYRPHADWDDPTVIPKGSRPLVHPTELESWPVSILPPAEGSLDAQSLDSVIAVLNEHTAQDSLADCSFYYGVVAFMHEGPAVYAGDLRDLPSLVRSQRGTQLTPNNIWPADHSWLIYTDYDLYATQVSGSPEIIDALCAHRELDTLRAAPPT